MSIDFWLTKEKNQKYNMLSFKVLINTKVNIVFQFCGAVVKTAREQQTPTKAGEELKRDDPCSPWD